MRTKIVLFSACAILLGTACHKKENNEEQTKFIVTSAFRKDTSIVRDYVCQIRAISHIEIRALERGYIESIYVDEGKFIHKGQLMFQIMPMMYKAEMQKAEAEANFAEIEYLNTRKLADSNVVSPNELALAKAKLDKAKAELSLAKVRLGFTEIRAPFDGIMDHFQVRIGSLVDEGDLLTTMSDNSKMWVYFNVPEAEYLNYKAKVKRDSIIPVQLRMANGQLFGKDGKVETIEADFNNETGNIAFRATFPNPEALLRHGETGNVQMTIPLNSALIIPQKATFEVLEKKYVFVIGTDKIVHQREILIAAEMPDIYVIKAGLRENERVLLEGIRKVKDGDALETYAYEEPTSVIRKLSVYVE
ncbi:MAG TPA: efflux RND transporter periplasmic adaptor subunit [Bacteroidia bacterium]|nr:efflux RND transporter periplasmic adaptor subunit [Bacteroidia bacterium]